MMRSTQTRVAGSKMVALGMLLAALVAASLLLAAKSAHASTTFTVNSTADRNDLDFPGGVFDGSSAGKCFTGTFLVVQGKECTLRAAIQEANRTPGADTIEFDIPGTGVNTIAPTSELPRITGPVSINGYSQPGASPNTKAVGSDAVLKIELSGAKVFSDGLEIGASGSTVKGLVINQWSNQGIRIDGSGATGNRIAGNFIGTDASGATASGNGIGVRVYDGSDNTIGGTTAAARNVISGNYGGVYIGDGGVTKRNKVVGNFIGTDATGTKDLGNDDSGVYIEDGSGTTDTIIGGTTAAERNVISGNDSDGIGIYGGGNRIAGNFIGTDAAGTKDLGNDDSGVYIESGKNNTVGGATSGARNVVSGNDYGVFIFSDNATNNRVSGNFIGTSASGTQDLGNASSGVVIGAPNNTVGGTTAGERNVISGNNHYGVLIFGSNATGNRVRGNHIGTDRLGTAPLGNGSSGIRIEGPNNTVGGAAAGERNVISGNNSEGVKIDGSTASGNKVVGNYVGTDATGTRDLGNGGNGVSIFDAPDNTIGGTTAAERNVVSGNGYSGVFIEDKSASGNKTTGNYIGTGKDGATPLGNSQNGVYIRSSGNTVGGTTAGTRNVISGNEGTGVLVEGVANYATGNRILSNSIFANGLLGIDLFAGTLGPTANDPGDTDTGPNGLQNKPVLASAKKGATSTRISGTLDSNPNLDYKVQFFANAEGADEGKRLLGSTTFTTDLAGKASFAFTTKKEVEVGQSITATATGAFGTSEFSAPKQVVRK